MHASRFLGVMVSVLAMCGLLTMTTHAAQIESFSSLRSTLDGIKAPKISQPVWLKQQIAAAQTSSSSQTMDLHGRVFTYSVMTKGAISADFSEFQTLANETLNDPRGWARLDASFKQVASGGDFTLVLAQASLLPTFSSGCSAQWSCNAGKYVVINQDRWLGATSAWNAAGGSLRDYRHMVVNHETGHWLGHSHEYCSGTGQLAPVMQQQSIGLQGCKFNPWPLASELWTSR